MVEIFAFGLCALSRYIVLALVPYLLALVPSNILLHSKPKWPCPENYEIQGLPCLRSTLAVIWSHA